jgi:RNA polymerase sigma factor (sigma-70 family)
MTLDAETAYRQMGPALVRKAQRMLRNREDALDIVQSLFMELLPHWNPEMNLPYLYRATTNRCINRLRDEKNRSRLLGQDGDATAHQRRTRCDEQALETDLIVRLSDLLDDAHMEILTCRFIDDMTQDETAAHLGVSRKTVGKRLATIRAKTQKLMDGAT